jgi:methionyl-tRNA formyltransferase
VLVLGSESGFCFHALEALLEARVGVAGVLIAAGEDAAPPRPVLRGAIPVSQPGSVADFADREGITKILCIDTLEAQALKRAQAVSPDVLLVACLPERLDLFWLELAPAGCFNIHPSLLPRYRGPAPLFWQLRDGCRETGVTVHRVEARMDAGPILVQDKYAIEADDTLATLNARLAAAGASAFAAALDAVAAGAAELNAQDEAKASHQPWPGEADFSLDPQWPAARAFRFVHATQLLGQGYSMETQDGGLLIERALDFDAGATLDSAFTDRQGVLTIRFSEGVMRAVGKRQA